MLPEPLLQDPERPVVSGLPGVAGRLYIKLFGGLTFIEDLNNLGFPSPIIGLGQDPEASGADCDVECHRPGE